MNRCNIFTLTLILSIGLFANFPIMLNAAELEEIQQRGKLIVAVKNNVRPLGFIDAEGKLQGLEIDIARNLAAELLGNPDAVVLIPVNNEDRLKVLLEGKVDLTIARVTATKSRSRVVDFSYYYYFDGTGLITKNPLVQNFRDLSNSKIAVLSNSSTIAEIKDVLPNAQLLGVNSYQEALSLLETNQAEAFAADRSVLAGWVQEYPQYRLLEARLSGEPLAVVMPRGLQYASLRSRVNQAIASWRSSWLPERIKYWGLPFTKPVENW